MKIGTLSEFYNFIKTNNLLSQNNTLMQICICADQVKNICSCKPREKSQKLFECSNRYSDVIKNLNEETKNLLLSQSSDNTIEFFNNNSEYITTISTNP